MLVMEDKNVNFKVLYQIFIVLVVEDSITDI